MESTAELGAQRVYRVVPEEKGQEGVQLCVEHPVADAPCGGDEQREDVAELAAG